MAGGGGFLLGAVLAEQPIGLQSVVFVGWLLACVAVGYLLMKRIDRNVDTVYRAITHVPREEETRPSALLRPIADLTFGLERTGERIRREMAAMNEEREKLAAVLDSMQDWVFAVDAANYIRWANKPMRDALNGSLRPGAAIVQTIRDPEVLECLRLSMEGGVFCQRKATGIFPGHVFDVRVSPIPEGGAVAVLRDSTRMEQVERTQREFIANVSHELRTPLTSISGYVETLLDHESSLTSGARNFLDVILKNATRMTRLTEDLLALARVESGEDERIPQPLAAEKLITDAIASVRGLVEDAGATVTVGETTPAKVMAAQDAIVQVLSNLIENATRYGCPTPGAPARVEVSATLAGQVVQFRVRDWGPGIPSEHQERIFERFYRVDKARSRETGGTGLGLSIARHIVEQHGGAIWVESKLGAGSSFLFTLPVAP